MRLKATSAIMGAVAALGLAATSAQALPAAKSAIRENAAAATVDKIAYRCWWRYGHRHCSYYRPYAYYGYPYDRPYYRPYYGYGPAFSFYIGPRYRGYGYRRGWW
jgi:hypothetical protein